LFCLLLARLLFASAVLRLTLLRGPLLFSLLLTAAVLLGPLFRLLLACLLLAGAVLSLTLLRRPLLFVVALDALHLAALLLGLLLLALLGTAEIIASLLVGLLLPLHALLLALGLLLLLPAFASGLIGALLLLLPAAASLAIGPAGVLGRLLSLGLLGLASLLFVVILRITGSRASEKHEQNRCLGYPSLDRHGTPPHFLRCCDCIWSGQNEAGVAQTLRRNFVLCVETLLCGAG